jgi:hypothetical protein
MFQNFIPPSQRGWITTSIAWLSVCIIAAAWGKRLLPNESQDVWGLIGIFGLASALGLASIAKLRRDVADKLARSHGECQGASKIAGVKFCGTCKDFSPAPQLPSDQANEAQLYQG